MCFSRRIAQLSTLLLALLLSVACGGGEQPRGTAPEMGPIIPFGQAEVRDLAPTTQVVPNCSGISSPVVNHPSMTVGSAHSVEWRVGGSAGMGATIGQGIVPGGVNLQAALEGQVANDLTNSIQQTSAWDLPAEPGYIMEYTIMWREVWQPAYLDVTFLEPEPEIMRIDVKYRTGIQSDIVGQKPTLCDPGVPIAADTRPSTVPPASSSRPPANTSQPAPTTKPFTESCGPAKMQGPLAQATHTFDGPVHVVQLWRQNGQSPWGISEVMAVVIGPVTILEAGGNVWTYPSDSCRDIATIHMQDGAKSRNSIVVSEQELREAGLIR